jgi:hypothetical protein
MSAVSAGVVCERVHAVSQNETACVHVLVCVYTPASLALSLYM